MKKILTLLLVCSLVLSNISVASAAKNSKDSDTWPKGPSVSSDAAIIMDASTGLILYQKKIHKKYYPASITKILTTLLAIENCSLNEIVTFSRNAIFGIERDSSHIGIDVGEKLTVEQCLYGIMLESANEVAYGIAEHVSGSMSSFADLMNKKAKELGCTDSHFVNSNGLHNDKHYTSAHDMALIARAAINNSTFRKVTSTVNYVIPPTNIQKESRYLTNHHKMLKNSVYHYDSCMGGKTGYTTISKNTLVTYAKKGDMELICVVMHSDPVHQYTDTEKLLDFGFNNYTAYDLSKNDTTTPTNDSMLFTRYHNIYNKTISPLQTSGKTIIVLPNSAKLVDVTQSVNYNNDNTLKEGVNTIGSITYTYDGKTVGSTNVTYNNIVTPTLVTKVTHNKGITRYDSINTQGFLKPVIIICLILACLAIFAGYYFFILRDRKRKTAYYKRRRKSRELY